MFIFPILLLITGFTLFGCNRNESPANFSWQEFCCRDQGDPTTRTAMYRGKIPSHWRRKDPLPTESIQDTTKALTEFYIGDLEEEKVYLTLFTFPAGNIEQRVPPVAQLERWKRQFEEFDPTSLVIEPRALGGFTGFSIHVTGLLKGQEKSLLGFSMQLAPIHVQTLQNKENASTNQKQMAADYTIKAVGPPSAISRWESEITLFANSFELIKEIPLR